MRHSPGTWRSIHLLLLLLLPLLRLLAALPGRTLNSAKKIQNKITRREVTVSSPPAAEAAAGTLFKSRGAWRREAGKRSDFSALLQRRLRGVWSHFLRVQRSSRPPGAPHSLLYFFFFYSFLFVLPSSLQEDVPPLLCSPHHHHLADIVISHDGD